MRRGNELLALSAAKGKHPR